MRCVARACAVCVACKVGERLLTVWVCVSAVFDIGCEIKVLCRVPALPETPPKTAFAARRVLRRKSLR